MRTKNVLAAAALLWLVPASPADAAVALTIHDGRVTLTATGATVREILAEWAKVGQTKIVNGERISGGPVTLQLADVPEEQALEIILRSVSGYVAAPRPTSVANTSRFDRIFVMPTSTPPRNVAPSVPQPAPFNPGPPPAFNPQVQPPSFVPPGQPVDADPDVEEQSPPNGPPNRRAPIFNPFPQPQFPLQGQPGGAVAPQTAPGIQMAFPTGAAVPGMIVQPPQQPGRPVPPGQPVQRPPE